MDYYLYVLSDDVTLIICTSKRSRLFSTNLPEPLVSDIVLARQILVI